MRTEKLDATAIVRQDEQQVGLKPLSDSEGTFAILAVDLDPFLRGEWQV